MASIRRRSNKWQARVTRRGFTPVTSQCDCGRVAIWSRPINRNYDRLPAEVQAELPLKKVWMLVVEESGE